MQRKALIKRPVIGDRPTRAEARDARRLEVLQSVVQAFIALGQPVGSKTVTERAEFSGSPATVRALMAELEEIGYLRQPHTSAGRVPTAAGYQKYADLLLEYRSEEELNEPALSRELMSRAGELPLFLHETSRALGELCLCVGVVLQPSFEKTRLRSVHFLRLEGARVVAVVVGDGEFVSERVVRLDADASQTELDVIANYITNRFQGHTLRDVHLAVERDSAEQREEYDAARRRLLRLALESVAERCVGEHEVYVDGAAACISNAEFEDVEKVRNLLRAYEQKDRIAAVLRSCLGHDGVQIHIGGDDADLPGLRGLAFVISQYHDGERALGSVGVLGPARMPYKRVVAVVDRVARDVSAALQTRFPA